MLPGEANSVLEQFLPRFNRRFRVPPKKRPRLQKRAAVGGVWKGRFGSRKGSGEAEDGGDPAGRVGRALALGQRVRVSLPHRSHMGAGDLGAGQAVAKRARPPTATVLEVKRNERGLSELCRARESDV